jgi:hypothetical protein
MYRHRVDVPNVQKLKYLLFLELHKFSYARHPGYQKTITIVKNKYYWLGMEKEVSNFIARCLEFQKVKDERKHRASFLQTFSILEWKWEFVNMDFITKISRTTKKNDYIMVVVDKLTKFSHFISVKSMQKETNIAEIFMQEIAKLHGVPKTIVFEKIPISHRTF